MKIRLAADLQMDSIVDGCGIRTVLWTQGCRHNCPGCHNPETQSFTDGALIDVEDVIKELDSLEGQDGVTFSGGDPFYQPEACAILAKHIHELGMNVWCFTGFTYEQLLALNNKHVKEFLNEIDVLVDGPFIKSEKSLDIKFRGSKNQNLIDVKKSLLTGEKVVLDLDHKEEKYKFGRTNGKIYI